MKTFGQLQRRIQEVEGVRFEELAAAHGVSWPENIRTAKGIAGRLVEKVLGMDEPDNTPVPDLTDLGLEIKTIPLREGLRPLEDTKVTSLNYQKVCTTSWEKSSVAKKLRAVLFVPVVKPVNDAPRDWYVRTAFIWMPSDAVLTIFKSDYETIKGLVRTNPSTLSSAQPPRGQGEYLMARTSGRNAQDTVNYEWNGLELTEKRRAFFLRKNLVEQILIENVLYRGESP